jgi:hypothetical protein
VSDKILARTDKINTILEGLDAGLKSKVLEVTAEGLNITEKGRGLAGGVHETFSNDNKKK